MTKHHMEYYITTISSSFTTLENNYYDTQFYDAGIRTHSTPLQSITVTILMTQSLHLKGRFNDTVIFGTSQERERMSLLPLFLWGGALGQGIKKNEI